MTLLVGVGMVGLSAYGADVPELAAVEETGPTAADAMFTANNLWMMLSAALVFIMHLGFATVESGLTRAKNTTNILFKNSLIVCIGILTYAICGFNLMYPGFEEGSKDRKSVV